MNSKPWYLSKGILGSLVAAVVTIAGLFGLHLADLAPQILDAISKQIDATVTIAGLVVAIYGRIVATKAITLGRTPPPLHLLPFALALGGGCVLMTGCAGTNPAFSTASAASPSAAIESALPLIHTGAAVATGAVLDFAVQQSATRTRLANEMYSSASAVYSLTGGTMVTPTQLSSTLTSYGQPGDAQYAQYVTALDGLYSAYFAKLSPGDAKTSVDVLNAIAGGIEDATQSYVTTPAAPAAASPSANAPAASTAFLTYPSEANGLITPLRAFANEIVTSNAVYFYSF